MLRSILTTGLVLLAAMIGILLWARMPLADDLPVDANEVMRRQTWVFTAFVLLQFWNLFNVRVFGTGRSLGNGLGANLSFLLIALFILAGQILMVQLGGNVFRTVPLAIWEWGVLLSATALVLPLGRGIGGR
jgi:Ca2+-transporting ATPase